LEYELHLALEVRKQGPLRIARVRKSRLIGFPDGESFPWSYSEFSTRYGKDIIEGKVELFELASEEQLAEIERLLSIVKIEPATIDKWKAKAGAENFAEFRRDQAAGVIVALNKQVNPTKE